MYTLVSTKRFRKSFRKLDTLEKKRAAGKLEILKNDPKHPSLNSHWNQKRRAWQSSINDRVRILWDYGPGKNEITLIIIGDHAVVE